MDDRHIVAGLRRGSRDALAALYDRYADLLHDYARRRTHSQADAADVVHDAFLVAVERIEQLRDPDRLRPWLYAIARTELHRTFRRAARYAELDPDAQWHEPVSTEPGPDVLVERGELAALLREATAGLSDGDRELLDLHLRHGLVGADLAAAAGMPAKHASVALERVKGRLARTLGVVLLARRPPCEEFDAIRDAQPGLTPLARKRLARHVDNCDVCYEEQSRRLRPEVLLTAVPMLPAPPELRRRLVSSQARLAPTGQFWDDDGFPWPQRQRSRSWPMWIAAAAAVLLVTGGVFVAARAGTPERTVGSEPIAPARTATTRTPVPGAVVPPTTTVETTTPTSTTTTTRRTTTTTTPPRTTAPGDTAPPAIGSAELSPGWFSATLGGKASCSTRPPAATRATVTTTATDPAGVAGVTMIWSGPGGTGGTVAMDSGRNGEYSASVGPVAGDNLAAGNYPIAVTVVATDARGNEARRSVTFSEAVHHCAVIG